MKLDFMFLVLSGTVNCSIFTCCRKAKSDNESLETYEYKKDESTLLSGGDNEQKLHETSKIHFEYNLRWAVKDSKTSENIFFENKYSKKEKYIKKIYRMLFSICEDPTVCFFSLKEIRNVNYIFSFKNCNIKKILVKVKKDEDSFENYLKRENFIITDNFKNKNYFYFLEFERKEESFLTFIEREMIMSAIQKYNSVGLHRPLEILNKYPKRKILQSIRRNDQIAPQIFLSLVLFTIERIKSYDKIENVGFKAVSDCIKANLMGNEQNNENVVEVSQFFKYLFKYDTPVFKHTQRYVEFKKYILEDETLHFGNNMSISSEDYIHDMPFSIIELIFDSFYSSAILKG
ncbi:hypothetical protein NGRA_1664 [Nosema granulosis]|uniref:Uncharacterized protein n=1 Tax=Nosema granulosis TaxID=83296 RepID=A0A9P6GY18_9MICR|nr:hypothetical protein NGRA_1664 [Nosema granulosis]